MAVIQSVMKSCGWGRLSTIVISFTSAFVHLLLFICSVGRNIVAERNTCNIAEEELAVHENKLMPVQEARARQQRKKRDLEDNGRTTTNIMV